MDEPRADQRLMKSLIAKLYSILTVDVDGKPPDPPQLIAWASPALPFQAEDLLFGAKGLTGKDGSETRSLGAQAERFAQLVDFLPSDSGTYIQSGSLLSSRYNAILTSAKVRRDQLTADEKDTLDKYRELVSPVQKERKNLLGKIEKYQEPSDLEVAYRAGQKAYFDAVRAFNTAQIAANVAETSQAVLEFQLNGRALRSDVDTAMSAWINGGYKGDYETMTGFIQSVTGRSMQRRLLDLRNRLEASKVTGLQPGQQFFFTSFVPATFLISDQGWTKFTFKDTSEKSYDRMETNGFTASASGSYGLFSASASAKGEFEKSEMALDTSDFEMSFEVSQVLISRPWFDADFIQSDAWKLPAGDKGGPLIYTTSMVLARNIKVDFAELHKAGSAYKESIEAKAEASYGPFSLSGTYNRGVDEKKLDSKLGNAGLEVNGMQVIGFRCTHLPKVPNPNPDIPENEWQ